MQALAPRTSALAGTGWVVLGRSRFGWAELLCRAALFMIFSDVIGA